MSGLSVPPRLSGIVDWPLTSASIASTLACKLGLDPSSSPSASASSDSKAYHCSSSSDFCLGRDLDALNAGGGLGRATGGIPEVEVVAKPEGETLARRE